jgi:zinc/manganese transport system substrate-binding protein
MSLMKSRQLAPQIILGAITVAATLLLSACGSSGSSGSGAESSVETSSSDVTVEAGVSKKVVVVTTTTQLTDFVTEIGGDNVEVIGLVKANTDPHDFEATPADLDSIASAAVIVKNGVGLEKWFDATVKSAEPKGTVVDASVGVKLREGDEEDPEGDPHIWQNPQNAKIMVKNIADGLTAADPANAATYAKNLASYSAKIDQLDVDIAKKIDGLKNKKLVTNHDAFGYYIDRFKLEFVGSIIPSFDTATELSATELQALVSKIKAEGVKAIFSESSLPPKTAQAIGEEAGVKVVEGEDALYGDTLGAPGSPGATYIEMMRHNTDTIVANLSE